jgi:hypothetical protein
MQIKGLSATGIKDFLQCQLKTVFRYDRDIKRVMNDHARIGISVHEALEQFTRRMVAKQSFPDQSDYDFAITTFMNKATEEGLTDMGFYEDGKTMIIEWIDRYDPSEQILDVEHFFKIKTPDGVPIVGAIDKVRIINDDTIEVVDYKTSRTALTSWQLKDDIQLSMYDLAASIIWPEYSNRILTLEYPRIDKTVSSYRTKEQRETFREFLISIWKQMNELVDEETSGRINNLCGWCDYKNYCPAYAELVSSKDMVLTPLADMEPGVFLDHWVHVASQKSILENRQREMKMIASERAVLGETISSDSKELYSTQAGRTNYDIEDVVKIIPSEDLYSVLAVNKAKLDRFVRERPELKDPLSKVAKVSYNAPVYRVKEHKIEKVEDVASDANSSAA